MCIGFGQLTFSSSSFLHPLFLLLVHYISRFMILTLSHYWIFSKENMHFAPPVLLHILRSVRLQSVKYRFSKLNSSSQKKNLWNVEYMKCCTNVKTLNPYNYNRTMFFSSISFHNRTPLMSYDNEYNLERVHYSHRYELLQLKSIATPST